MMDNGLYSVTQSLFPCYDYHTNMNLIVQPERMIPP